MAEALFAIKMPPKGRTVVRREEGGGRENLICGLGSELRL